MIEGFQRCEALKVFFTACESSSAQDVQTERRAWNARPLRSFFMISPVEKKSLRSAGDY